MRAVQEKLKTILLNSSLLGASFITSTIHNSSHSFLAQRNQLFLSESLMFFRAFVPFAKVQMITMARRGAVRERESPRGMIGG